MANHPSGADSEVGRLRSVLLHRPGPELQRLTPRNNDRLLFDGIPWVARAQEEHDAFAAALRERDVEVVYLTDLLTETLALPAARAAVTDTTLTGTSGRDLGDPVRAYLRSMFEAASPEELTYLLTAGVRNDEVRSGLASGTLVTSLLAEETFLVAPLPNLLFTRDSSVWLRDRVAITSLAMPARRRETQLTELIYHFHPRFAGTGRIHGHHLEHVEGGEHRLPGGVAHARLLVEHAAHGGFADPDLLGDLGRPPLRLGGFDRGQLAVDDGLQGDDGFAVDPTLEVQATQPAQLAGRPQVTRRCAVILEVDWMTDRRSEIGEARRKKMRGAEQIGLNGHRKTASAVLVLPGEFGNEGIGVGRLQHQAIEQDVDGKAAFGSRRIEHQTGHRAAVAEREPTD